MNNIPNFLILASELRLKILELARRYPNDMDLGAKVRALILTDSSKVLTNDSDLGAKSRNLSKD
jgi:hypothetical protein